MFTAYLFMIFYNVYGLSFDLYLSHIIVFYPAFRGCDLVDGLFFSGSRLALVYRIYYTMFTYPQLYA